MFSRLSPGPGRSFESNRQSAAPNQTFQTERPKSSVLVCRLHSVAPLAVFQLPSFTGSCPRDENNGKCRRSRPIPPKSKRAWSSGTPRETLRRRSRAQIATLRTPVHARARAHTHTYTYTRARKIIKTIKMADISVKESPFYNNYKSLITTSTPQKSINDSGYNTPSSTLSSNLSHISEISISFDHTPSDHHGMLQVSSATQNFTDDHCKLEDITNTTDSGIHFSPPTYEELSPSKKFKFSSDMRMRFRINRSPNDEDSQFLKRKNLTLDQNEINHERISVEGRENLDIMYFLAERNNFEPVTEKIFSFLSGSDIISMSMVSKTWCGAVKNSLIAQKKKRMYFKLSKENRGSFDCRDRSAFYNKGCLANIANVMRSPSKRDLPQRSPPVSPSKYRFHVFQKEAKKLSSDQQLVKCPRCTRPASWSPSLSTRAECKGIHCKFIFCTKCMCEYANNFEHKCLSMPILSISSYNRRPLVTSLSKRKRNLRRLLT
ncbi:F-box domain [Cinara cedri]|uniref:F-box domain n=1 Tax=Cinara cedri TaxID=506608 RepID=A0A5E4NBN0_9HEMI|nr:F-box domain [Cinara cedri]